MNSSTFGQTFEKFSFDQIADFRVDSILLQIISQGTSEDAQNVFHACSSRIPPWTNLLAQFKQWTDTDDVQEVEFNKQKFTLDSVDKTFFRKLARTLDILCADAATLVFINLGTSFMKESTETRSASTYTNTNIEAILRFYFSERTSSVRALSQILKAAVEPSHWFHEQAKELSSLIISDADFPQRILTKMKERSKNSVPSQHLGTEREALFRQQALVEEEALAELYLWSILHLDYTAAERVPVITDLVAFINSRQVSASSFKGTALGRNIFLLSSFIQLLELPQFGNIQNSKYWTDTIKSNPNIIIDLDNAIHKLSGVDIFGFIFAIWASFLLQYVEKALQLRLMDTVEDLNHHIQVLPGSRNQQPLYVQYAQKAFKAESVSLLAGILSASDFMINLPDSRMIVCSAILNGACCFLNGFELKNLPLSSRIGELLSHSLRPEVLGYLDIGPHITFIGGVFDFYSTHLPASHKDFLSLATRLIQIPESSPALFKSLYDVGTLSSSAQYVEPSAVHITGDNSLHATTHININPTFFTRAKFNIPTHTPGVYIRLPKEGAIVQWKFRWNVWNYFLAVLSEFVYRPREYRMTDEDKELLFGCLDFVAIAAKQLTQFLLIIDRDVCHFLYEEFFPNFLEGCSRLFDNLGSAQSIHPQVASKVLDVFAASVALMPQKIWAYLNNANILTPRTSHLPYLMQSLEGQSGEYSLSLSFLTLLDKLLLKSHRNAYQQLGTKPQSIEEFEVLDRYVDFYIQNILLGFPTKYFKTRRGRQEFIGRILAVVDLILSDTVPLLSRQSSKPHLQQSQLAQFGGLAQKLLDHTLGDPAGKVMKSLLSCLPSFNTFIEDCQICASLVALNFETTLKIIQSLISANSEKAPRSSVETLLVSGSLESSGFHVLTILLPYINAGISHQLIIRSCQLLCQISERVSHWKPKAPSFASVVDASVLQSILSAKLKSSSSSVQSLLIRFATICLSSQPGLALEFAHSKSDTELSVFVVDLIKLLTPKTSPELLSATFDFLRILWSRGASFSATLKLIKSKTEILDSMKQIQTDNWPLKRDVNLSSGYNIVLGHVYDILACDLIVTKGSSSQSKMRPMVDDILSEKNLHELLRLMNDTVIRPDLRDSLSKLAQDPVFDLDALKQNSWAKPIQKSIDFGKYYVFNTRGLRNSQLTVAELLEDINVELSTTDGQRFTLDAFLRLIAVYDRCCGLSSQQRAYLTKELTKLVFSPPADIVARKVRRKSAACLYCILPPTYTSVHSDLLNECIIIAAANLEKHDISSIPQELVGNTPLYIEYFQIVFLLLENYSKSKHTTNPAVAEGIVTLMKYSYDVISYIILRFSEIDAVLIEQVFGVLEISVRLSHKLKPESLKLFISDDVVSRLVSIAVEKATTLPLQITNRIVWLLSRLASTTMSQNIMNADLLMKIPSSPLMHLLRTNRTNTELRPELLHDLFSGVLSICIQLLVRHKENTKLIHEVIFILDDLHDRLDDAFKHFQQDNQFSLQSLDDMEHISTLLFLLARDFNMWKHRFGVFAEYMITKGLSISCFIIDLMLHTNRFAELLLSLDSSGESSSKESASSNPLYRQVHLKFFKILRNVFFAAYVLSQGWQTFLNSSSEWNGCVVLFLPFLESASLHDGRVALGTLNVLLAFCRDRLKSSLSKLTIEGESRMEYLIVVLELIETSFLLFVSQMQYALGSENFDARQKEQIRLEIGGEIIAAIDAYSERFEGSNIPERILKTITLLKRLKQFVEPNIRR